MHFKDETIKRLRSWATGQPAPPLRLTLHLTGRCNLDCLFCDVPFSIRRGNNGEELDKGQWEKIVQDGLSMGVLDWWFSGKGEPTYYPDRIVHILDLIKTASPQSYCHITTNGTRLDENACKKLVELGVDDINCSIDAPIEELHDYLRNRSGTFKQVKTTLERIARLKTQWGVERPEMRITFVLTEKNYMYLPEMVEFAIEHGVNVLGINPLRITHENERKIKMLGLQTLKKHEGPIKKLFDRCARRAHEGKVRFEFQGAEDLSMGMRRGEPRAEGFQNPLSEDSHVSPLKRYYQSACYEPFYTMGVDSYGKASHCTSSSGSDSENADVAKLGLKEVWYGPYMMSLREQMLNHQPAYSCFGCGIKNVRAKLKEELLDANIEMR